MVGKHDDTSMADNGEGWRGHRWRIAAWTAAALILLVNLVAMQFSDEVNWDVFDFVIAGVLLSGTILTYELVARKANTTAYRVAVGIAVVAALLLVWINLAVGIIGSEDENANLMYFGVLAVGLIGAFIARFRPYGMVRTMFVMATAHAAVGVIALAAGWGATGPTWPLDILGLTGFFGALFVGSGLLFQKAAREGSEHE